MPTVTVGLPLRNGSPTLRRSIESLLAQDFGDFELVISDNASSDDSFEIASGYAERDPRIRLSQHAKNIGAIPNFKTVLDLAQGRYFIFAAHDDEYEPHYIGSLVEELERNPDSAVAGGSVLLLDDDAPPGSEREIAIPPEAVRRARWSRALRHVTGKDSFLFLHFGLFRTPFIRKIFLPVPLVGGSDWLFILHVLLATDARLIDRRVMTRHVRSSQPSVAKYLGEPNTPGYNPFGWVATCGAGMLYLLRSKVLTARQKLLVPPVLARFALWLSWVELQRITYAIATRTLGDDRRRRIARFTRRLIGRTSGSSQP